MKRNKPMPRSGFKQPAFARPPKAPLVLAADRPQRPTARVSMMAQSVSSAFRPQPKFTYYRSEAIQRACRLLPCTSPVDETNSRGCGSHNGVAWAHSNWGIHGKGKGIKASDQYVAALCSTCHGELDQGAGWTEHERQLFWWMAHVRTVVRLTKQGLWPADVPIPDVLEYPFPIPITGLPASGEKVLAQP
jgi:hypothetical protein